VLFPIVKRVDAFVQDIQEPRLDQFAHQFVGVAAPAGLQRNVESAEAVEYPLRPTHRRADPQIEEIVGGARSQQRLQLAPLAMTPETGSNPDVWIHRILPCHDDSQQ